MRSQGATGTLLGATFGDTVQSGPYLLAPGEMVQASVASAPHGVGIVGSVYGTQNLDPSNLPSVSAVPSQSENVNATISGPVPVTAANPYPVADGGLAGSVAQALSQPTLLVSQPLTTNATTTVATGAATSNPYPQNAASWQIFIRGMAGASNGMRIVATKSDGLGNTLGYMQRDSCAYFTLDTIVCTGIIDAPALTFSFTLPSGAPSGCVADIYTVGYAIQDNFYDSGIYEDTSFGSGSDVGYDGGLARVNISVPASSSVSTNLPTYRGPAQLAVEMSTAGHLTLEEQTYTGGSFPANSNIPVSASGLSQQLFVVFLGATCNVLVARNDDASNANSVAYVLRAIRDLLD